MAFFEARGFFGDYEVTLQLPNGLNTTQTFTLSPGSNPVVITLHLPGICFIFFIFMHTLVIHLSRNC